MSIKNKYKLLKYDRTILSGQKFVGIVICDETVDSTVLPDSCILLRIRSLRFIWCSGFSVSGSNSVESSNVVLEAAEIECLEGQYKMHPKHKKLKS